MEFLESDNSTLPHFFAKPLSEDFLMVLFVPNHVPVISLCTVIDTSLQSYRIGMQLLFSFHFSVYLLWML